ncbi:molybdenum cofactor biosynthesis protein MoaE [Rothia sp. LK2588]|uniref:molybdenum cofactor biosynthesis protein MoaE n=1 Tax=Rothia sp. LK2588 TaxID=3114369 RepID=UPI0034CEC7DB
MTINSAAQGDLEPTESTVVFTDITEVPLEPMLAQARSAVMTDTMGALVVFDGVVRNHDHGAAVAGLSYTAHPQAQQFIAETVASVTEEIAGVRLWAVHRVGPIPIGESALTVLAAAAHRGTAFQACQAAADRIKAQVPIWKEQELADGSIEWVGIDTVTPEQAQAQK